MKIVKICAIHGELTEGFAKNKIRKYNDKKYNSWACRACFNAKKRAKHHLRRDKRIAYMKEHYQKNKEAYDAKRRKWIAANKEYHKNYRNIHREHEKTVKTAYHKRNAEELTDSYIKSVLVAHTNLKRKDISPELIEIKRAVIKIRRIQRKTKQDEQWVQI